MKFMPKSDKDNKIEVYTDGACRSSATQKGQTVGEHDKSAYAFFLSMGGHEKLDGGAEYGRTNNYMEIKAVLEALRAIKNTFIPVVVYSDSTYVINSINKGWIKSWKKRNWTKSDGSIPANVELWKQIDQQIERFPFIQFNHVKGHSGNEGNELVDKHVNYLMDNMIDHEEIQKETENTTEDWKRIKNAETVKARTLLQEAYELLESENFHDHIEVIEKLTGVDYNG